MTDEIFHYIIVGAGSAGCVLAARLTEDSNVRVLLLEAGGSNKHWAVDMPLAVATVLRDRERNWHFHTEAEPGIDGRSIEHPRGRMLGGSSSLNGMVYSRGHALDYDGWASSYGCAGWSYSDVLPYFRRSERYEGGEDKYRGGSGPLAVTVPRLDDNVLNTAFIQCGREAGYPLTDDQNGYQQEGFGPNECTIEGGRRFGAARAYLEPALTQQNLCVLTHALTRKVLLDGPRAVGVSYQIGERIRTVRASREVILSAGAFSSPQLLMLSGIGDGDHLRAMGIDVALHAEGVGKNLQDHPDLVLQKWCKEPVSLYSRSYGLGKIATCAQWFLWKTGPAAWNQFHAAAFIRTQAGIEHPDLKLELLPIAVGEDLNPLHGHSFQVHMTMLRAKSRGAVELASADQARAPVIKFNYMSAPDDIETMRRAVNLTREILVQKSMQRFSGAEIAPGDDVRSDEEIDNWVRSSVATAYHPVGTCRMGGGQDPSAVLNPDLRVRGIDRLRVVDASVMPMITSSNTNASTIMIAEKASDMIRGRPSLPRAEVPVWSNPNWRTGQR